MTAATLDALDLLDLDLDLLDVDDVRCEYRPAEKHGAECGQHASWWLVCRTCRHHVGFCRDHITALDQLPALQRGRDTIWVVMTECSDCGRYVPAPQWRVLYELLPVGGA